MKRVGITGQNGFVGKHIYNTLALKPEKYQLVEFEKEFFNIQEDLDAFVERCDVIIHLAAMNRHESEQVIYDTNVSLVKKLVESLDRTKSNPHVFISSSTQEERDNLYGRSKRIGRELLVSWAERSEGKVTGLLIPNVF